MSGILNGERKSDAREQRSEIDSVCFSFRIVKIWMYSHLAADFPLMDGYSEAVAGLLHNLFIEQLFFRIFFHLFPSES